MKVDLLIENGIMVIPRGGLFKGCLGIVGEKIVGIYASPRGISAREVSLPGFGTRKAAIPSPYSSSGIPVTAGS